MHDTPCPLPETAHRVRVLSRIADLPPETWDACANPASSPHDPFMSHAFLRCLEESGSASARAGWSPRHLALEAGERVLAVMPLYLKSHSMGEYVFDHSFADAYARAGGRYYPKLQTAAPFTPVTGRRILARDGVDAAIAEAALTAAARGLAEAEGASSHHLTFLTRGEWERLGDLGYLRRTGVQFHWRNEGYERFDDFLERFASRKRKAVKKERRDALAGGLTVEWLTGAAITEAHWDAFFAFYMDTGGRKWGRPYLNRRFFSLAGAAMGERLLLILAKDGARPIAGALNVIGGDTLFGRYWGCVEERPFLHFELCYHQAIDYAIAHGLNRVEAGAQGEHKLARGYLPETTYSAHWFAHPGLSAAVERYLERERPAVEEERRLLLEQSPFKRDEPG
ncbi:MAG: GNAT family N-acetyltransferase [Hyphomicrobiales bacterium]|nr:GNAT family N-acetyltransferase [Hyphomicrobiales bacterium]